MIRLLDGPAEGTYAVKRAPLYLRAVITPDGKRDVLDQVTDTPAKGEAIHVYIRVPGTEGTVHLNMGGGPKSGTGFYALGQYHHLRDVEGEALRDTQAWRAWAREQTEPTNITIADLLEHHTAELT